MNIINKKTDELIPYDKNPRKNEAAVPLVAESIKKFGFKVPIVIDKDNILITGHTRLKAAKKLGYTEVPCLIADDLTPEEIKAFRLADNKVAEKARWDLDLLQGELDDIIELDMEAFDFDIEQDIEDHVAAQEHTQEMVENILNLGRGQYYGDNYYGIPELKPTHNIPEIKEWIGFNYVLTDKNPAGKGVHFFIDDYQFERIWNNPDKYMEKLTKYAAVATPDFSPYGDMPMCLQIYNHYRKHWIGARMQEYGINVVPTIRSSTDERSFDWYLEGEPEGGAVIISSMWASKYMDEFKKEYLTMYDRLHPELIYVYGKQYDWMPGNIKKVDNFTTKRWNN